jgi:hypothetical protein
MKSLLWLAAFFIAANALGSVIWFFGSWAAGGFHVGGAGKLDLDLAGLAILLLGVDSFFGGAFLIAAAAAAVRKWFGKLTGFTAGATALVTTTLLGWVAGRPGAAIGAAAGFVKLLGAILLAHVPFFRRKVLEVSPRSRVRGLSGTYAISLDAGESPAVALGRRAAGERRWVLRRARPPERWDLSFASFRGTPREATSELRRALFANREALLAWGSFPMGALAGVGCAHLLRLVDADPSNSTPRTFAIVILVLLAPALFRHGALRLYERARLLRLLREGEVVLARRTSAQLFDQRGAIVTVGETQAGPIVVASPAPLVASDVQGLLVGKNGDVVAWDLLPVTPAVDSTGAITVRRTASLRG